MPSSGVQTCALDRKSTRLNSSHLGISYAVFCLKKSGLSCDGARKRYRDGFSGASESAFWRQLRASHIVGTMVAVADLHVPFLRPQAHRFQHVFLLEPGFAV